MMSWIHLSLLQMISVFGNWICLAIQRFEIFLQRKQQRLFRFAPLIAAFLESKGYLEISWYENLEHVEREIDAFLRSRPKTKTSVELDEIYVFEGYAHTEGLIAYILGKTYKKGIAGFSFVERIYQRENVHRERGRDFQLRLDEARPNNTDESMGYMFSHGYGIEVELYDNATEVQAKRKTRVGFINTSLNKETREFSLILNEDGVSRAYVKRTQGIDDKQKNTINLSKRLRNNIIKRGRLYYEPKQYKELMQPIFFEERDINFSDLDYSFLKAAELADTLKMAKCLLERANVNVCDPETGKTALHLATKSLSPFAVCMLIPKELTSFDKYEAVMSDVMEYLQDELDVAIEDIDHAIRNAQQHLNPLILDKEYNFASSESEFRSRIIPYMKNELDDPLMDTREDIENIVGRCTFDRLRALGITPVAHNVELEDRLAILEEYRATQNAQPLPPSI